MHRIQVAAWLGIAALFGGAAQPALGQDEGDFAAFFALLLTPIGALPPLVRAPMLQGGPVGGAFHARYGHYEIFGSEVAIHNIGVGGDFPAGTGRMGATLAFQMCDGCDGTLMFGLDYTAPLLQRAIGADPAVPGASTVSVALSPSVGVARPLDSDADATFMSAAVGLPVSLAAPVGRSAQLVPFVTPGFGFGLISSAGETESGVRFMLGGGLGIARIGPGIGVTLGFQKIFIEDGPTQWGVGLTWHNAPR
jgi:hypothetical protein